MNDEQKNQQKPKLNMWNKVKPALTMMWDNFKRNHPILGLIFEGAKMLFQKKNKVKKEAEVKNKLEAAKKHLKPKPRPLPEEQSAKREEAARRIQQLVKPKLQKELEAQEQLVANTRPKPVCFSKRHKDSLKSLVQQNKPPRDSITCNKRPRISI